MFFGFRYEAFGSSTRVPELQTHILTLCIYSQIPGLTAFNLSCNLGKLGIHSVKMAPAITAKYDWILAITTIAFVFSSFGNGANDVANSYASKLYTSMLSRCR